MTFHKVRFQIEYIAEDTPLITIIPCVIYNNNYSLLITEPKKDDIPQGKVSN